MTNLLEIEQKIDKIERYLGKLSKACKEFSNATTEKLEELESDIYDLRQGQEATESDISTLQESVREIEN